MMYSKVIATDLPSESQLHQRITPTDFIDCYSVFSDASPRQAANIITEFPGWARLLLVIRRIVTSPFGISQDGPDAEDKVGVFPVESESGQEMIAGFDDRHLEFRISVLSLNGQVYLATWVHPHNIGGWLYLKAILPFHILIARNALMRVAAGSGNGTTDVQMYPTKERAD